ncbi:MAG: hypothetical protein JXR12_01260 [Neptunomonas phycophila]|uniref:hypothetical protein n=1 Tax=Neptunomonas phycophila TaxID=1572645 RepID=UPI003B8E7D4E
METLKIDNEVVLVSSLPDELKQVVTLYEYTINEEIEARKKLAMIEAGRSDIASRLTAGYKNYKARLAEAEAEAAAANQAVSTESTDESPE